MGPGRSFPANPDLADIFGDMDLDLYFDNFNSLTRDPLKGSLEGSYTTT